MRDATGRAPTGSARPDPAARCACFVPRKKSRLPGTWANYSRGRVSYLDMKNLKLRLGDGEVLLDRLLDEGVDISRDCGGTLACASCRVIVREGLEPLEPASEDELDMLERAGAAAPGARLACQVKGL